MAKRRLRAAAAPASGQPAAGWPWGSLAVAAGLVLLVVLVGLGLSAATSQRPASGALSNCVAPPELSPRVYASAPAMCIDAKKTYQATITTTKGDLVVQLFPDQAPKSVNAFTVLALNGYYNGLSWFKVQDWVVQTGDPTGSGRFSPGFTLPGEVGKNTWEPGSLGFAHQGDSVNGGQFFVTKAAWPGGDPTQPYNHFGTVVVGVDLLGQLTPDDRVIRVVVRQV